MESRYQWNFYIFDAKKLELGEKYAFYEIMHIFE